jgi:hypothetical protein
MAKPGVRTSERRARSRLDMAVLPAAVMPAWMQATGRWFTA